MAELTHTKSKTYSSLGQCIYCGSTSKEDGLHMEHIIPDSIGGRLKFEGASCHECEKLTHAFEGRVISHLYGDARAQIGIRRGHSRKWPDKFVIRTTRKTGPEVVEVSIDEHPGAACIFNLKPAGIFLGSPKNDRDFPDVTLTMVTFKSDFYDRIAHIGGRVSLNRGGLHVDEFARFLAKIAHVYAVAELGLDAFKPVLTNAILDKPPMLLSHYVGGQISDRTEKQQVDLHELEVFRYLFDGRQLVIVRIQLFAFYDFPAYELVVGEAAKPAT